METVVLIIMVAVGFSFILKLTFHRLWGAITLALLAAGAILLSYEEASSQSKTQIADWLANPPLMLDISVWLTVDVAFQSVSAHSWLPASAALCREKPGGAADLPVDSGTGNLSRTSRCYS